MPKFSTVQAYSDNNSNVQTVSYQQATGGSEKAEKVKTEKVVNAYGSTAGANSGEFHVYRQARARELSRMETLTQQQQEAQLQAEFQAHVADTKALEEARTAKKRLKRQKHKQAKKRRHNLTKAGIVLGNNDDDHDNDHDNDNDYKSEEEPTQKKDSKQKNTEPTIPHSNPPAFVNDGSFLAMMQQKLAQEQAEKEAKQATATTKVEEEAEEKK